METKASTPASPTMEMFADQPGHQNWGPAWLHHPDPPEKSLLQGSPPVRPEGSVGCLGTSEVPDPRIIGDPIVACPLCMRLPVLRELSGMTGNLCYSCWVEKRGKPTPPT